VTLEQLESDLVTIQLKFQGQPKSWVAKPSREKPHPSKISTESSSFGTWSSISNRTSLGVCQRNRTRTTGWYGCSTIATSPSTGAVRVRARV